MYINQLLTLLKLNFVLFIAQKNQTWRQLTA